MYYEQFNNAKQGESTAAPTIFAILFYIFVVIIILLWWISGVVAFFMSLVCCFYSSSLNEKFLGIVIALVLGPFYWLYYIYNMNYCLRNP